MVVAHLHYKTFTFALRNLHVPSIWADGFASGIFLVAALGIIFLALPTKKIPHWKPSAHMLGTCRLRNAEIKVL